MSYLNRLVAAEDLDGWTLSLLPLGTLPINTGKLSISDPSGDVPKSLPLGEGDYPVRGISIAPDGQPSARSLAAVLVEIVPGKPANWEDGGSTVVGELICLCDADVRYRMEEWAEDGKYEANFYEDVAVPALMDRGRWRLSAVTPFDGQKVLLARNGNIPGEYPIWKGMDGAGNPVCYLLDLGLFPED